VLLHLLLLLLLIRQMMAHGAPGRRTEHGVMASNMARHRANGGTFQTPFRLDAAGRCQQRHTQQ
jgi:hypothetical protein